MLRKPVSPITALIHHQPTPFSSLLTPKLNLPTSYSPNPSVASPVPSSEPPLYGSQIRKSPFPCCLKRNPAAPTLTSPPLLRNQVSNPSEELPMKEGKEGAGEKGCQRGPPRDAGQQPHSQPQCSSLPSFRTSGGTAFSIGRTAT